MKALSLLPDVRVRLGGNALSVRERDTLASIRVQQRLSLPTLVELTFLDPPPELDLLNQLAPGTTLDVALASSDGPGLFRGDVTAVEHAYGPEQGLEVRVRGYDRLHRLRKRQQLRTFEQLSLDGLARELIAAAGLGVNGTAPEVRWSRIAQHGQTDLELLQEILGEAGVYFVARGDTVRLLTLEGEGAAIELHAGGDLWDARFEVNADRATDRVWAGGWDPRNLAAAAVEVSRARLGRSLSASVSATDVGGDGRCVLPDQRGAGRDQIGAQAQAELDRRALADVVFRGTAQGDPRLRPGALVRVRGVARPFEGDYVLTSVTHVLDEGGYRAELETEPPVDHRSDRPTSILPGTVTAVDDPDRLGRVRVEFDALDGIATEWMPVLLPAAGADRGLVALPDVDDRVLVVLPHGDPARGVVLGAVFGTEAPQDSGVVGGRVRRYTFQTRGGQRLTLDDEANRVRLEDASGTYMEFGPDAVELHATTDLTIEAPGRRIVIVADAVDFERR